MEDGEFLWDGRRRDWRRNGRRELVWKGRVSKDMANWERKDMGLLIGLGRGDDMVPRLMVGGGLVSVGVMEDSWFWSGTVGMAVGARHEERYVGRKRGR